jgi:hypothetical protein
VLINLLLLGALMKFHRFAYSTALRDGDEPRPFKTRDGAAFCELAAVLTSMGWEYGSLIYNYPSLWGTVIGAAEVPSPGPGEWVVLTTRPPLDDETHGDKRTIPRSHFPLEQAIFDDLKPALFEVCARSHVRISEGIVGPHFEEADFEFRQNKDGRLSKVNELGHHRRATVVPEKDYRSIAFFIKKEQLKGYGCGVIACFSMGGSETLIWNRIVRERFPHWLAQGSSFIVAELDIGPASVPDPKHGDRLTLPPGLVTLDFVKQVAVREIINKALP